MTEIRAEKITKLANRIPDLSLEGGGDADLLVIGWGGTYGSLHTAVKRANAHGKKVAYLHFNYINPMPKNTAELLSKYKKILVAELNLGQMVKILRDRFPENDFQGYNKVQGMPFTVEELMNKFEEVLNS